MDHPVECLYYASGHTFNSRWHSAVQTTYEWCNWTDLNYWESWPMHYANQTGCGKLGKLLAVLYSELQVHLSNSRISSQERNIRGVEMEITTYRYNNSLA